MIYDGNVLDKSEIFKEIVKVDDVIEYEYIGEVKKITLPMGSYKFEVYGAEGGYEYNQGKPPGKGGYSQGIYSISQKFETLYICVGGAGKRDYNARYNIISGGYNGGGNSGPVLARDCANGSGGGASHIALKDGILSSLSNDKDKVIIVAGGGGGSGGFTMGYREYQYGGAGGGLSGGYGECTKYLQARPGTQTGPGTSYVVGSFGRGGNANETQNGGAGGGGGWYGGGSGYTTSGGAGGSGYIGYKDLTEATTTAGVRKGNGFIKITVLSIITNINSNIYKNVNQNNVLLDLKDYI